MRVSPTPYQPPDYDPQHPTDAPLTRCKVNPPHDPRDPMTPSLAGNPLPPPPDNWLKEPKMRPWYYQRLGDLANREHDLHAALQHYHEAAALFVKVPANQIDGFGLDAMLQTSDALYQIGDRTAAGHLWLAYLHRTDAPDYTPMAHALKRHRFRQFFKMMVDDYASYTNGNLNDRASGGLQWLYAGAEAGARGDDRLAQARFLEAIHCVWWDDGYVVFAWAAAAYAHGDYAAARNAWLAATVEGDTSPGDMPFNGHSNAAAVTMMLTL